MNEVMRILVVDDSLDDRELCKRILTQAFPKNIEIFEAQGGESGLVVLDTLRPDCILLDYSLPGRNGIEILKELRIQNPFLPVIMLTGQGNEAIAVQVMKAGAQDYIVKSAIKADTIQHMIVMAIEHCALRKKYTDQQEALGFFTKALAHDLKEPLRTILSFADFMARCTANEVPTYASRITTAARNMEKLINTVRSYTQLSDQKDLVKEDCPCQELLEAVLANLDFQIKNKNARIIHDSLPTVHGNRTHLEQLLQNLIANAITHCDKEIPQIHISSNDEGEKIKISVEDNGPGIDEKHRESIFQPFKRLNRSVDSGSGLGLAICKKIVEHHNGVIYCTSEIGKGSIFHFTLAKGHSIINDPVSAESNSASKPIGEPQTVANILLVEDNPDHIELTKIYLTRGKKVKFNLYTALNGEEAVSFMQNAANPPIHLILLDVNMPVMDGFEFLQMRKQNSHLQKNAVVVCSTSDYDKDMRMSKELGAVDYVQKPVTLKRLSEIVSKVGHMRLHEENGEITLVHLNS